MLSRMTSHARRPRLPKDAESTMWRGRFPFMSARRESAQAPGPIQLTVAEGIGIPRGVAYISPAALAALGCAADDVVEITGPRTTVARAHPWPYTQQDVDGLSSGATPDDSTIQMDGLVRQNSGAALGDLVTLHAAQAQPAVSVALVPVGGATALNEAELRHVARSMRGLVVLAGDLVRIPGLGLATREFQVFAT